MSTEIKFRAKAIKDFHTDSQIYETGEWVYGLYTKTLDGLDAICCQMIMECGGIGSGLVWVYIPIDIKTLSQFTGLKDKNDEEIYEGDVISINDKSLIGKIAITSEGIICEHKEYCYKYFHQIHCEICDTNSAPSLLCYYGSYRIEVIGNIYENPELLRGAK